MKTRLLIIFILAASPFIVFSQGKGNQADFEKRREEIKAQKIAFITERVNLSPAEAQKFWPLSNELEAKKQEIMKEVRQLQKRSKTEGEVVDYDKLIEAQINAKIKTAELEKEYYLKFKTVLSPEKIYKLIKADKDFQKELLGRIQQQGKPAKKQ